MKRRQRESDNNWLVSYADLVTLLVGFFVLVVASSKPDSARFEQFREEAAETFRGQFKTSFQAMRVSLGERLKELGMESQVQITKDDKELVLVSQGTLFFDTGSVTLREDAEKLVKTIAQQLSKQETKYRIIVEGHTDDVPVSTEIFPSNWELSSNRAGTVVRLLEQSGIKHEVLRPVGLADTAPLVKITSLKDNELAAARAQNRRIVIRIIPNF